MGILQVKNTGVSCRALLQGNRPNPEIKLSSPSLQVDFSQSLISPFPEELGLEMDGVLSRTDLKRELLLLLETGRYSLSQPSSPKVRTF